MKETLVVIAVGALVVAIVAGVFFWYTTTKPFFEPGMVRSGKTLRASLTPPQQPDDPNVWKVEADIQLHYFSEGRGPAALVVHGGPGMPPAAPWPGLSALSEQYTFHYYHQRGCGQSTRPIDRLTSKNPYQAMAALDRTLGLGAQIADIERIRRILDEEKLILVGHSFGGFLASLYAAEFPERVEAVILIAPADVLVMPQEGADLFEAVRKRLPDDMLEEYDAFLAEYLDFGNLFTKSEAELAALNAEFGRYYAAVANIPVQEQGEPGGWMVSAMYVSMGRRHDYRKALKAVQAPVLVIHGEDDLQSESTSRTYSDLFPNKRFTVIGDVGHFPFYEKPGVFSEAVAGFLSAAR
jgi:proline iminopeptidase